MCQGAIFESAQAVQQLMVTATTCTGLKVFTTILDKTYQTGRKVVEDFKSSMKIIFGKPELQVI